MSARENTSRPVFAASRSLQPGQILANRYRIAGLLGHGGMGEVYEAEDTVLGMSVALKTIRGESDITSVRRFQRELVLARSVAHTNVCRVFDFGSDAAAGAFYTMELLRGKTLAEVVRERGPLPVAEARRIIADVTRALEAAHAAGIVHRDLKPANIFITDDARVVVTDFGLARSSGPLNQIVVRALDDLPRDHVETASLVAGTPAYMAPEQLSGAEATVASDIYALGVVMYEMTAGKLPWTENGLARFTAAPQPPRIEPAWDGIVVRCLLPNPVSRFRSASQLRAAVLGRRRALSASSWVVIAIAVLAAASATLFFNSKRAWTPRPEAASWYGRGLLALHDGDFNSAAKQLQMSVDADKNFAMAHARLAEAWAEQDYSDRARQAMLQAATLAAKFPVGNRTDELRLLAIQMMIARDFPGSLERYQEIARRERSPDTLFDYARALERNSQTAEAIGKYREAIALQDDYPASWARLGYLLARSGKLDEAARAFAKAESLYNAAGNLAGLAEVHLRRAQVLEQQGQLAAAKGILDSALRLAEATGFESQRIRILLRKGVVARLQEQSAEAGRYVSEALNLASENRMEQYTLDGLLDLGNVYLQKLELDNAEKHYSNALRIARALNSRYHEARAVGSLASIRSVQGRLDDARNGAEKALSYFRSAGYQKESLAIFALLAQVRGQAGDSAGALSAFQEQLKLTSPQNTRAVPAIHLRIGISLANLERYTEALAHLNTASTAPDMVTRAFAAINKADILAATGDLAGARAIVEDSALFSEPTGTIVCRVPLVRTAAYLAEERFADAEQEIVQAFRKYNKIEPAVAARLRSLQAIALAHLGRGRSAIKTCAALATDVSQDPKMSAIVRLNCAEAELAARDTSAARRHAAEAEKAFENLGQAEAQWRACSFGAFSAERSEASAQAVRCEAIRKVAADRWGHELWGRYLTRPDVRDRIARLDKFN